MVKREQWERRAFSLPDFKDYRAQATKSFDAFSAFANADFSVTGQGEAERVNGELVSADYFATLGIRAQLGRLFTTEEDDAPNAHAVALISGDYWRNHFASAPGVIGKAVRLNEHEFTIIGVLPADFRGLSDNASVWIPMAMLGAVNNPRLLTSRGTRWHEAVARLKPGVTLEQARAELAAVGANLAKANPESNTNYSADVATLREEIFGDLRRPLLVLMGAVALVLVITCANVANLLLVRLSSRAREIAIRLSLGASRAQLARLLLTETALLAALGGTLGLLLASWLLAALTSLNPGNLPHFATLRLDLPVFAFAAGVSVLCTLTIGLLPLVQAARADTNTTLKDAGRTGGAGAAGPGVRAGLIVVEIALSLALLTGAGLLIRSFVNLTQLPTGFKTEHLLAAQLVPPPQRYKEDASGPFRRQLLEKVSALPGVSSAALASDTPLDGNSGASFMTLEGASPVAAENEARVYRHSVTGEFFQTAGIPLLVGASFGSEVTAKSEAVVVVSAALARKFGSPEVAIGKRLKFGKSGSQNPWVRIVGVVADTKYRGIPNNPTNDPDAYFPFEQNPSTLISILVSTRTEGSALAADIRKVVAALDPMLPVFGVSTMEERIGTALSGKRFTSRLMGIFAGVALVLAAVGLYGVVSFSVGARTQEIGVRMALGARPADIFRQVIGSTGRLVLLGLLGGVALSLALSRLMESMLFNVRAQDPAVYAAVAGLLAFVSLLAAWLPARRAAQVDPMVALRTE
jgi:putative ABC transport system permease protein